MLGLAEEGEGVVVADFEAGIGTLTRLRKPVDAILVVVEPTKKSLEVGSRGAALARADALGPVLVIANRIRDDADRAAVRAAFPDDETVFIDDDPAVEEADRQGRSPVDTAADGAAVIALEGVAALLATRT